MGKGKKAAAVAMATCRATTKTSAFHKADGTERRCTRPFGHEAMHLVEYVSRKGLPITIEWR